ncbi:MAG TPA: PD-(D/E)XK nuclease-like domain-containing protein [Polyangiaceae bacterium]
MPPLHFSQLKAIARSPLHYKHGLSVPLRDTKSLRMGRAVDAILFGTCGVVDYKGQRRGKEWEAFAQANAGSICLNATEAAQVRGMAKALEQHSDAMYLLSGTRQRTIRWKIAGRECEGTPDSFRPAELADLKTCESAQPARFPWKARQYGWTAQVCWYREGLEQAGLAAPSVLCLVAVESKPPHPVTVFELTERAIDEGTRTWRLWFERLRACEESNEWPAYAASRVPFDAADSESSSLSLVIDGEETEID